jgi:nucleotide-binding universal stress UspA family protein
MARAKSYLVPVDFSRTSSIALNHAVQLARENKGKLILLHVIVGQSVMMVAPDGVAPGVYLDYEKITRGEAQKNMAKLRRQKSLKSVECQSLLVRRADPARAIATQARRLKATMIVMGSHGRTGLRRLVLGSVAERTLRYAQCPVLIVKK